MCSFQFSDWGVPDPLYRPVVYDAAEIQHDRADPPYARLVTSIAYALLVVHQYRQLTIFVVQVAREAACIQLVG